MRNLIALTSLALLTACGAAPTGARDAVLGPVPADSPLLLVMESAPEGYFDRRFGPVSAEFDRMLELLGDLEVPDGESDELARLLRAVSVHLRGRFNEKGMAEIGFRQGGHTALYTDGGLPVLRMELASGQRFIEFVKSVAKDAGHEVVLQTWEEHTWWAFEVPDTPLSIVFVVQGDVFAGALLMGENAQEALPRLTGRTPPKTPLLSSTRLADLREAYGFTWYVGVLELDRLAVDLLERLHAVEPVSPACRDEHQRWFAALPKMHFGMVESADPDTDVSRLVIPLSKTALADARAILAPPPGLAGEPDAVFVVAGGLGLRVGPLFDWVRRKAAPIRMQPYQCDALTGLNGFAGNIEEQLRPIANTPVPGLTGLTAAFTRLELGDFETMRLRGVVVLGTADAAQLLGFAALAAPGMFGQGVIPEDGKPYPIELPPQIGSILGPIHLSRSDRALGVSAGKANAERLAGMVRAEPQDDGVFARMNFDSSYIAELQRRFAKLAGDTPESPTDQALARIQSAMSSVYDHYSSEYRLTDTGIDVRVVQTLKKP